MKLGVNKGDPFSGDLHGPSTVPTCSRGTRFGSSIDASLSLVYFFIFYLHGPCHGVSGHTLEVFSSDGGFRSSRFFFYFFIRT